MTEPKTIRAEYYDDNGLVRVEYIPFPESEDEVTEENINTNTNKQNDIN
jgi:hypothetical protein